MYLTIDLETSTVALKEANDFWSIKVVILGEDVEKARSALGPFGSLLNESEAMVLPDSIRHLCTTADKERWEAGFGTMLFHAQEAGWMDDHRREIRVPCEWDKSTKRTPVFSAR